jgi:hypothetical protein
LFNTLLKTSASFSGSALLIAAVLLPWPELMVLIHEVAYPFSYVALGLAVVAFFAFRRRKAAAAESPDLVASGAD